MNTRTSVSDGVRRRRVAVATGLDPNFVKTEEAEILETP